MGLLSKFVWLTLIITMSAAIPGFGEERKKGTFFQIVEDSKKMGKGFSDGYKKGQGHVGDKLIEGMIESVTPQADDSTRRVQRNAVKFLVDPNRDRSEHHLNATLNAARSFGDSTPRPSNTAAVSPIQTEIHVAHDVSLCGIGELTRRTNVTFVGVACGGECSGIIVNKVLGHDNLTLKWGRMSPAEISGLTYQSGDTLDASWCIENQENYLISARKVGHSDGGRGGWITAISAWGQAIRESFSKLLK